MRLPQYKIRFKVQLRHHYFFSLITNTASGFFLIIMPAVAFMLVSCLSGNTPDKDRILFMGNSITWHPKKTSVDWQNDWGMAATARDSDYVHKTISLLSAQGVNLEPGIGKGFCSECQGLIEQHITHLQEIKNFNPKYAVIQLAEHSSDEDIQNGRLKNQYERLLAALDSAGVSKVFCIGCWGNDSAWTNSRNREIKAALMNYPLAVFVDIQAAAANSQNYGDILHFSDPGVLWHPGNSGMRAIAQSLAQEILSES